jgi:imidazolonepropionase-like amidohydrolase
MTASSTAPANAATDRVAILAGTFLDGTLAEPRRGVTITIAGGTIRAIADGTEPPRDATVLDLRDTTVLPGLINMHAHTILPGDGTAVEAWSALPDELLVLQAAANAGAALRSGVTTIRDCGGKGRLMFRLRDAIRTGIVPGPRFVLSGRPLTITGGHCRQFGGEVDGPEGLRRAARELLREGADFIKLMAAGGGTIGTYPQYPAFDLDELRMAIDVAHQNDKPASCHCIATASIARALDAGTDHIEHCSFMAEDTTWRYDEALARRLAAAGVYVTATLQVGIDSTSKMKERHRQGIATPQEARIVTLTPDRDRDSIENIRLLHAAGVPLVAGNDAGWRYTGFDDFYEELIHLHHAGLSTLEAIHAATGRAAAACRLPDVGRLAAGCVADILAVPGDPLADLGALADPALVMQGGQIVRDAR